MAIAMNVHSIADSDWTHAVADKWEKKVRMDVYAYSHFERQKGAEGSAMPVIRRTDFTVEALGSLHFTTMNRIYNEAVTGESELRGNEPKTATNRFSVTVDWVRNGLSWSKPITKRAFVDNIRMAAMQLGEWNAWNNDCDIMRAFLDASGVKVIYAGDATSDATLGVNNVFLPQDVSKGKVMLARQGAKPIKIRNVGGAVINRYAVLFSDIDAHSLMSSNVFEAKLRDAWKEGESNPMFAGLWNGFEYDGMLLYALQGLEGILGTPLRPEAAILGAHNDAATTITVGANDKNLYTKHFPASGTLSIIKESTGAREFVTYTAKTAYTFTTVSRGQTYGGTTSVATNYVTGDLVTLFNHRSSQIFYGAEAVMEGVSQELKRTSEKEDYDFFTGVGTEICYGVKAVENYSGKFPNFLLCRSYAPTPV